MNERAINDPPPVSKILMDKGIPHEVFVHPGLLRSLEQAARERGQSPVQVVRSILFRVSQGEYVLVLIAGPKQVNWKSLRNYLSANRVTMATKEEVLKVTGYQLGAVAPFGLRQKLQILIDRSVLSNQIISMGSGVRGTTVILKSTDLITALGDCEIVDLMNA